MAAVRFAQFSELPSGENEIDAGRWPPGDDRTAAGILRTGAGETGSDH